MYQNIKQRDKGKNYQNMNIIENFLKRLRRKLIVFTCRNFIRINKPHVTYYVTLREVVKHHGKYTFLYYNICSSIKI